MIAGTSIEIICYGYAIGFTWKRRRNGRLVGDTHEYFATEEDALADAKKWAAKEEEWSL